MVQAPDFTDVVREHVIHSKAAEEIRREHHYRPKMQLDDFDINRLYEQGLYLLRRFRFLHEEMKRAQANKKLIGHGIYSLYRELADFGLEDVAGEVSESYRTLSK